MQVGAERVDVVKTEQFNAKLLVVPFSVFRLKEVLAEGEDVDFVRFAHDRDWRLVTGDYGILRMLLLSILQSLARRAITPTSAWGSPAYWQEWSRPVC